MTHSIIKDILDGKMTYEDVRHGEIYQGLKEIVDKERDGFLTRIESSENASLLKAYERFEYYVKEYIRASEEDFFAEGFSKGILLGMELSEKNVFDENNF